MIFFGFDTSCYTTSVAAVDENGKIIASKRRLLSVPDGQRGLRQSEGFYQHVNAMPQLYGELVQQVGGRPDAIAVSEHPRNCAGSYMPVFYAGVRMAEMLSHSFGCPLYRTDHQSGHIMAALYASAMALPRFLAVHLSGGTTEVLETEMKNGLPVCKIAMKTGDISAGQLIDRVGVALGFSFPSGRFIDELAVAYDGKRIKLPVYIDGEKCSLSGTEAAAMRAIEAGVNKSALAEAVMDAIVRTLCAMLENAALRTGCFTALISGGVASSKYLRAALQGELSKINPSLRVFFASPELSADNACGVALIAQRCYAASENAEKSEKNL